MLYAKYFAPDTYYKMDTAQMFQESVRAAVLEAVDGLTSAKGHRMLTELERKPILRPAWIAAALIGARGSGQSARLSS